MKNKFRNLLRHFYHWLPLNQANKMALKFALFSRLPSLSGATSFSSETRRTSRAGNILRAIYYRLPLSSNYKNQLVNICFRYFPFFFKNMLEFQRLNSLVEKSVRPWEVVLGAPDNVLKASNFSLPTSLTPRISVIIPVYGKIDYTLKCLRSIANGAIQVPFEVIVVNDCSPDNTQDALNKVLGLRVISNQINQGFIRSCNNGAAVAHGEYLCFLNNDTEVCAEWLDELIRTFDDFPGVGLAGSRLVYPDGKLQEAGGIIWRDGSAWNFGRGSDPCDPMFNYVREADYISGASILIQKKLFDEFGGFDELYLPAYGEDSDLALKVRSRGLKVMYQPLSVVIHYEGITSGTDVNQGVKAYQVVNARKLYERWHELLASNEPAGGDVDRAKDRGSKYRVLVLDEIITTPDLNAGSVTVLNLMLLLRQMGYQVTFIPVSNIRYAPGYTPDLQREGIEVLYFPYCTSVNQHLKESGERYDLVFILRPAVAKKYLKAIRKRCPKAKVLYHTVDLHYLRMAREAELLSSPAKMRAAEQMKRIELAAIRAADASIVHSTTELELLRPELPGDHIHVFPLIMEVRGTDKTFNQRRDIVFVGGYIHAPNTDAVQYFITEVMPILRRRLPGVRFFAVGNNPPAEILALATEDIVVTGYVKDLNPLLDQMRVSVAPLRYGAGIKGKIGTAMVVGLPTVATSLAAEGMSLTHGENILVADGAEALAESVAQLYQDEALWNKLSGNGLKFAENTWGGEAAWSTLHHILEDIGLPSVREKYPLKLYSPDSAIKSVPVIIQDHEQPLLPVGVCQNKAEFQQLQLSDQIKQLTVLEDDLIEQAKGRENFLFEGFCDPCNQTVYFLVDKLSGARQEGDHWIPNWRERLVCPVCHMINRQRLIATLVSQELHGIDSSGAMVYFMEQVTPIYHWAKQVFPGCQIIGSEYLGYAYSSGAVVRGLRHEDVMALSFKDSSVDLIVSNDVFEHVPNPARAFSECARVLRPGGVMLATIPFHSNTVVSVTRATLSGDDLTNILPPVFHGNPVSADGSIVFTDFGWDILDDIREAGFSDARIEVYASAEHGYLGGGQIVFVATKGNKVAYR